MQFYYSKIAEYVIYYRLVKKITYKSWYIYGRKNKWYV